MQEVAVVKYDTLIAAARVLDDIDRVALTNLALLLDQDMPAKLVYVPISLDGNQGIVQFFIG